MSDERKTAPALDYESPPPASNVARFEVLAERAVWIVVCATAAFVLLRVDGFIVRLFAFGRTAAAVLFVIGFLAWSYAAVVGGFEISERNARNRAIRLGRRRVGR